MELKDFPSVLTDNREAIEFNFVFALWKDTELIDEYKTVVNGTDILTEDAIFYYGIASRLKKLGYSSFDNVALYTYLSDKKVLRDGFERRGGYSTVQEILELINPDNISTYYDELVKSNMILNLYKAGFAVEKEIEKFKKMSSSDLYDYYDYVLNTVCLNKVEKVKVSNLSSGYEEFIDKWDEGKSVGFKIGFPILNYLLAGVHKQNLLLHLGHIGKGKTTTRVLLYILPSIENGQNVCIIANEQGEDEWRQMILASVLFNKIGSTADLGMNRQKLITGHFTQKQREALKKAENWLATQPGKISFVTLNDYSITTVRKIIRKHAKTGTGLFVFDTLKPEQENSDKAWADFSEAAKELFQLSKKEDVAIIATAQLSSESMGRRYLDLSCVGKSRAIAETAGQVVMFRTLSSEEKEKLKPWTFPRDEETGKTLNMKKYIDLDPDKEYIVIFVPKNRFGSTETQLVYERSMAFNTMHEIGYIDIPYDGFKQR